METPGESVAFLLVVFVATMILILIERLRSKKPCWLYGCAMNHLSIEKTVWPTGLCLRRDHPYHGHHTVCYITKWICTRPGCGEMGYYCAGEAGKGSWTIQHGKVVPDEKGWSQWK